jgi:aminomethyltransferase
MTEHIPLKRTPLADLHRCLGAKMVPFAGWEMPLQFSGIIEEHNAVRHTAGVFDVSHMGRLLVSGPDAAALLSRVLTYNVCRLRDGQAHYALMCQEDGGIIDDLFVYRPARERFFVVGNALNAESDRDRIAALVQPGMNVTLDDMQPRTAMLAVQGPDSAGSLASTLTGAAVEELPRRGCREFELLGSAAFIAQSGYTGENGYEVIVETHRAQAFWEGLLAARVQPCGLGARDTLRLEAALPLYGNDIDRTTNPYEAGLGWVVDLDDEPFVGREALQRIKTEGARRHLVCIKAAGKGIMRSGYPVLHDGEAVGKVTSGGFSPTLGISIGMAYVPVQLAAAGTSLSVDVRGRLLAVTVAKRPFYKRPE